MKTHPNSPSVQRETSLLDVEHSIRLLVGHRDLESSLMHIRIERLSNGINLLKTMLRHGIQQDLLGHLQSIVKVDKLLVVLRIGAGALRNRLERAVKVVDRVDEIFSELLDGELASGLLVALGALLEVAVLGDGAGEFVLQQKRMSGLMVLWLIRRQRGRTL